MSTTETHQDFIKETIMAYNGDLDEPVNETGTTLLILAIKAQRIEIAELLLRMTADVNKADIEGNTPLHHAFFYQAPDCVERLIANGADESIEN